MIAILKLNSWQVYAAVTEFSALLVANPLVSLVVGNVAVSSIALMDKTE